ncbi:hypothetical protein STEG23_007665 [Scotinomys teguina]
MVARTGNHLFSGAQNFPQSGRRHGRKGESTIRVGKVRGPAGSRVGAGTPGETIPEDRKAEDVTSMDDVRSAEPAVVDDIGPAVPTNGVRA